MSCTCEVAHDLTFISLMSSTQVAAEAADDNKDDKQKPPDKPKTAAEKSKEEQDRARKQERIGREIDKLRNQQLALMRPGDPEPDPDPSVRKAASAAFFEKMIHAFRREYATPPNGNCTMEANQHLFPDAAALENHFMAEADQIVAQTATVQADEQEIATSVLAHQVAVAYHRAWPMLPVNELLQQVQFQIWQRNKAAQTCPAQTNVSCITYSPTEELRQQRMQHEQAQHASPHEARDMQEGFINNWDSWSYEDWVGNNETATDAASAAPLAPVAPGGAEAAPGAEATSPALAPDAAIEAGASSDAAPATGAAPATDATDAAPATDDAEHEQDSSWQGDSWQAPGGNWQWSGEPTSDWSDWSAPEPSEAQRRPFNAAANKWICFDS